MKYLQSEIPVITAESLNELNIMKVAVEGLYPDTPLSPELTESEITVEALFKQGRSEELIVHPVVRVLAEQMHDYKFSQEMPPIEGEEAELVLQALVNYSKSGADEAYRLSASDALHDMKVSIEDPYFEDQLSRAD